nr:GTPase HflX [Synechococcus elongatus]
MYKVRLSLDCLATPEFAERLAAISADIEQPITVYLDRRGHVTRVGVGNVRQTRIPPVELPRYGAGRLCGLRCLTTSLSPEPPDEGALTTMALQRLDALIWLCVTRQGKTRRGGGATGYVAQTYLAHLLAHPDQRWTVSPELDLEDLTQQPCVEFVEALEEELQRGLTSQAVAEGRDRVLLVGVKTQGISDCRFQEGLLELQRLVETAGGEVASILQQKRLRPHPQTVVGEGKVAEVALAAQTLGVNLVAFDRDLSPAQARNLEREIGLRVVDRTEVILDIFAQRAQSGAGKLQVELAQLEYKLPRLTGQGQALSRLGGGIGTRGPGETKLETERRAIQRRITRLQRQVTELQAHRSRLRQHRQTLPSIAIVGYTNAGKSTLLNILTQAEVYAADQLFATLDPTTRRLVLNANPGSEPDVVLLTDTVGFIHELPPPLVDAFRATLEEVTEADALLHLVDLSHPAWYAQIQSVMSILREMPVTPGPILLAFNKIDAATSETLAIAQAEYPQAVFLSASRGLGLETLRQRLGQLVHYARTH